MQLQTAMLPGGLQSTRKSYREESGQASLLETRLTSEQTALLKKIKTLDGTLLDSVHEWMELGARLGRLEDERDAKPGAEGPMPADVLAARNRWIKTVNTLQSVLDLVEADEPGVQEILNRIAEAEKKADRRAASASGDGSAAAAPPETTATAAAMPEGGKDKSPVAGGAKAADPKATGG